MKGMILLTIFLLSIVGASAQEIPQGKVQFGSQIVKTFGGGTYVKKMWNVKTASSVEKNEATKPTPKYYGFGLQSAYGAYGGSPYAQGNFGTMVRDYGLSKQAVRRFTLRPVEVPSSARVAAGSTASEPPAPEEPITTVETTPQA